MTSHIVICLLVFLIFVNIDLCGFCKHMYIHKRSMREKIKNTRTKTFLEVTAMKTAGKCFGKLFYLHLRQDSRKEPGYV